MSISINPEARDVSTYANTRVLWEGDERDGTEQVRVVLHETVIFQYDGTTVTLDSGGWQTRTTAKRINECFKAFRLREQGFALYSKGGEWFLDRPFVEGVDTVPFHDGMAVIVPNAARETR